MREREQLTVRALDAIRDGKRLDPSLVARLASAPQTGIPGYLLQLSRNFVSTKTAILQQRLDHYLHASSVSELYEKILERHEHDYERERPGLSTRFDELSVGRRRGLSESELLIRLELGNNHYHRHYGHRSTLPLTGC